MFYSRPQIDPLGWDLLDWPLPQGTKHFEAFTSDRRPVDFWFGGGWLTVSRGPVDAPLDCPEMEEVLSRKIAPFGTMDIAVEQIAVQYRTPATKAMMAQTIVRQAADGVTDAHDLVSHAVRAGANGAP